MTTMVQTPAEMQMHEDLAALLAQRLTLDPTAVQQPSSPPQPDQAPQITYSISQHYHHSAHIAKPAAAPEPPAPAQQQQHEQPSDQDLLQTAQVLASHGVNPESLSPALVDLFRTADAALQTALVGFWRLLPSDHQTQSSSPLAPQSTEELTRLFLSAREQQRPRSAPIISLQDSSSSRWGSGAAETEPYMLSGYEQMARREYEQQQQQTAAWGTPRVMDAYSPLGSAVGRGNGSHGAYSSATDPVYRTTGGSAEEEWARQRQQQAMEDQYGALMQMRGEEMEL